MAKAFKNTDPALDPFNPAALWLDQSFADTVGVAMAELLTCRRAAGRAAAPRPRMGWRHER
jgi:hypothetical protein